MRTRVKAGSIRATREGSLPGNPVITLCGRNLYIRRHPLVTRRVNLETNVLDHALIAKARLTALPTSLQLAAPGHYEYSALINSYQTTQTYVFHMAGPASANSLGSLEHEARRRPQPKYGKSRSRQQPVAGGKWQRDTTERQNRQRKPEERN